MEGILFPMTLTVLIESDWNLKFNGIALTRSTSEGINRIRLEFKVSSREEGTDRDHVLIESDWNLKYDAISA